MEVKNMIVYRATNQKTGESYVGQTTRALGIRIKEHKRHARSKRSAFYDALLRDEFSFEVVALCSSREEMDSIERKLISDERPAYNKYVQGGNVKPESHADNVRKYRLGKNHSPETIVRISEAKKGCVGSNKGRIFSPEQRARMGRKPECREIVCVTTGEVFGSQSEIVKKLGIPKGLVSRHINGKSKAVRGLVFAIKPQVG